MPIKLIRIDDRYIHGQVTVGWVSAYGIQEIWLVDDKLATNEFLKKIQLAMAPPGKKVEIITIQEAIEKLKNKNYDASKNIMIIFATPESCRKVLENVRINDVDWINVGQSGWKEGKIVVTKNFSVDEKDVEEFKKLVDLGYRLVYQMLPDEKPQDFYELLKRKGLT
ncbi:PTS sugar transporter subunit IIB [Thermococcus aggregans]|uniref:PTS sugar transporter subunit IIB n=1 Tax=Thermococcus aggregans TaxID=110163 RepID=A0A9E7MWI7_THEAG|nr:PTS sugar transporter subunit IIB [Thermococcus aggregans]USS40142.1 PTS sugar transporter subunit IIB [Thermococcus aggregans]